MGPNKLPDATENHRAYNGPTASHKCPATKSPQGARKQLWLFSTQTPMTNETVVRPPLAARPALTARWRVTRIRAPPICRPPLARRLLVAPVPATTLNSPVHRPLPDSNAWSRRPEDCKRREPGRASEACFANGPCRVGVSTAHPPMCPTTRRSHKAPGSDTLYF